jgi:hypothetical protein
VIKRDESGKACPHFVGSSRIADGTFESPTIRAALSWRSDFMLIVHQHPKPVRALLCPMLPHNPADHGTVREHDVIILAPLRAPWGALEDERRIAATLCWRSSHFMEARSSRKNRLGSYHIDPALTSRITDLFS